MLDTRDLISRLFRVALNRDGQARALEPDPAALGDAGLAAAAADAPRRRTRRERPAERPREVVVESLAQKVLHGWLQNRQQTLYPLALNFRSLRPDEVGLVVHAMAAALTADGQVDSDERARVQGSLSRIGVGEAERRLLEEAIREPRPLGPLLTELRAANLGSYAYAASLLALNQRNAVNRLYLDYLAARLAIPNDVVASLNRRYRM
jgi:uncharacterized membrane protein YebE (DUF533 family)